MCGPHLISQRPEEQELRFPGEEQKLAHDWNMNACLGFQLLGCLQISDLLLNHVMNCMSPFFKLHLSPSLSEYL